jgi:hypothetical protein
VVQLGKYVDFSLYSHHFSLLSLASLLSAPETEVTSPSDFKVVGALPTVKILLNIQLQFYGMTYLMILEKYLILISSRIF